MIDLGLPSKFGWNPTYGLKDSKRGVEGGFWGGLGGKGGWVVKNFFPHPNKLLIWAYPENLVKIGSLEYELWWYLRGRDGTGRDGDGDGDGDGDSVII